MKKPVKIIGSVLIIGILIYTVPRLIGALAAEPLHGIYDVEMRCMGGHEIFFELTEDAAYENCPGHRDRKKVGRIVRDQNSVTLIDLRDEQPWFRIDWDGSRHSMTFLKRPDSQSILGMIPARGEIQQVTNPWRRWIPALLPEE